MTSAVAEGQGTPCYSTRWKYGVHFCFFGQEIENRLIGHFKYAFGRKGIKTTIDDHENTRGEEISLPRLKAIEESRSSIVLFCHKFAYSTKCLDELVMLLDCRKRYNQLVQPLFFQIDPSIVRNLKDCYGEAMVEHRQKFKNEKMKVLRWQLALHDVANLSGWTFNSCCESKRIQEIVEDISKKLDSNPSFNVDCLAGLKSHLTEPQTLFGPGSLSCGDVDIVGKNGIEGTAAKCNGVRQSFQYAAHLEPFFTSSYSYRKESENGERFITVHPSSSTGSTSKDVGNLLVPKTRGIVQDNDLLSVPHSEGNGMKKRKGISDGAEFNEAHVQQKQARAEINFQLSDSPASQVSIPRGIEDSLIPWELKGNIFDSLNDASVGALLASLRTEKTTVSAVQDAGSVAMRTSEEVKSALKTLQTYISKNFCDLIPEGSKFMEYIQNGVLSFCADEKISQHMVVVLEKFQLYFTPWRQYYEHANTILEKTNADLLKFDNLQEEFAAVVNDSKEAISAEKQVHLKLGHLQCRKRELEEKLKAVDAGIADLSSQSHAIAVRKSSHLDKGTKLKTEYNTLMVQLPRLVGDHEAARVTQANIEAWWSKLVKVFNEILAIEFGCG